MHDKVPRFVAAQIFGCEMVLELLSAGGFAHHMGTGQLMGTNFTLNIKSNQFNFLISASFTFFGRFSLRDLNRRKSI